MKAPEPKGKPPTEVGEADPNNLCTKIFVDKYEQLRMIVW
jgi:hypothetical protein